MQRNTGEELGYKFPELPGKLALYGPQKVEDYLTPSEAPFLPLPELMDPKLEVDGLDNVQAGLIDGNHRVNMQALEGYHEKVRISQL